VRRWFPRLVALGLLAGGGSTGAWDTEPLPLLAQASRPASPPGSVKPQQPAPPASGHPASPLDCLNCHVGKHQGVVRMYLGMGGRGAPIIPSHMLQVRVECIACHIVPKEEPGPVEIVGQTFRPTEQSCVNCHGERYRGMLGRWAGTLAKMQGIVAPKLVEARGALAGADPKKTPKHARARQLLDDAEFNARFVALGKGVHNVFYAADLLKLSNGWLDEVAVLLGKTPARADDALVRGGYCGVLCHEQAGVKLRDTVTFGKQRIPHGRHVTELGAVCTACHSAETHKAMTATPATCSACHHSPQNDRCERCHAAQTAFYRGTVKTEAARVEPNRMADAVPCTGCHDFARRHSRQAVGQKCLACHEAPYLALMTEWTTGFDQDMSRLSASLRQAEAALARARGARRPVDDTAALVREARAAHDLVRSARGVHNPLLADALLETARRKAAQAVTQAARP
jgi:hypothetical protein